jgi:hypothetical protein
VGLCGLANVLQCGLGLLSSIPMRPEGRKAGGEKIKTPRSGVIIFFFSLFVKSFIVIKTVKIALTLTSLYVRVF